MTSRSDTWLWPAAAVLAAAALPLQAQTAQAHWNYRIQPGDTLIGLTETYLDGKHSWRDLQRLNKVADPLKLPPGGTLRLPITWLQREASVARVLFTQGDASLLRPPSPAAALSAGTELRAGDQLRTGAQSSISLRFVDGSRLLIAPDSRLTLEQLLVYGRSALPAMQLRLDQGGADSRVQPDAAQPPRYEMRTPSVNLGVRGTEFRVQLGAAGQTRVQVLSGAVAADRQTLKAGQGALAQPG
ncbi:FecR family protein, partial [Paucibacter sp. XJ19-41]|uniref:FecR family protein n=1 Tax=Paucibacter sp. XJ19-41 TaxID=2927824 RepID=UPI002349D0EF